MKRGDVSLPCQVMRVHRLLRKDWQVACILLLLAGGVASSAEVSATSNDVDRAVLSIGDVAPPLHIDRWLRGAPVQHFEQGSIYVLDFWALWCAPCISLMPHLSALQDRFADRGVRIIGVIGPDTSGTKLEDVEAFLERKRGQIRMTVAYDALDTTNAEPTAGVFRGITAATYFKRAQLEGIPTAIVIDRDGRIAWIGQPSELSSVLEAVSNGTWDRATAGARYRAMLEAEPRLQQFKNDLKEGRVAEAMVKARQLADGPYSRESGYLRLMASTMAASAQAEVKGVDVDLALAVIRRAEELSDAADPTVLVVLARVRFLRGDVEQAIDAQQRAVRLTEPPLRDSLEKTLQEYRKHASLQSR